MPEKSILKESVFAEAVYKGLTANPKRLPSRFIYDQKGDALFQQIMELPEYYLTRCETQILQTHKTEICAHFRGEGGPFHLVELGSGDGTKTEILLKHLSKQGAHFTYMPVDISANALQGLRLRLEKAVPELEIRPWQGTYFEMLSQIDAFSDARKVLLFLGSNLGNMMHEQACTFLSGLAGAMTPSDSLFIGFDQKKDPRVVLDAYNDPDGVTAAFNKNILHRINRELGADFDPGKFLHWQTYNPESGAAQSYLVARESMEVGIEALDLRVHFDPWETIHTELSQKYDDAVVDWLASRSGLQVVEAFADPRGYFKNYLFRKA